jgi:two-component system OmpR family response regulator
MGRRRVLIVEDHPPTRGTLKRIFARNGWEASTAATVAEGLEALDPPPDCVVLDLKLPDGDGEAILRKIRAVGLPTRVVVVTAGVSDPDRWAEVARLRPEAVLQKPIEAEVLCRLCGAEVG